MSTSEPRVERTIAGEADVEPVVIDGRDLESTAPDYLRDLKRDLAESGYQPAALDVEACFAEDCSLATQAEADRLRGFVRAASFLGASRVTLTLTEVADRGKVEPALASLKERARREGVSLAVSGETDTIAPTSDPAS